MAVTFLKTAADRIGWKLREITWRSRPLPAFLIIGAQKSGTSSLFSFLAQHPQLSPARVKEVHFFDGGIDPMVDTFAKGQRWYRAHFHHAPSDRSAKAYEASPIYLFNPQAAKRIHELIPQVKLIALLRNPAERAISHYFHVKRRGWEPLPIMEAMQAEEERLAPIWKSHNYKAEPFRIHSYKSRGLYKEQLDRFLNYFPREQMLLLSSERFAADPQTVLKRVFNFLQVDPDIQINDLKPRNVGAGERARVEPEVYEYLRSYFQPHHQAVCDLVGENLGW